MGVRFSSCVVAAAMAASVSSASASFHLIDVHELFTNHDGSVQFVELVMSAAGQNLVSGHQVQARANGSPTGTVTFPSNLANGANGAKILLATAGFGSLPGGVTPDLIIPPNFFDPGNFLRGENNVSIDFGLGIDILNVSGTQIPHDGINSLYDTTPAAPGSTIVTGVNSPENNAGVVGSVNLSVIPGDFNSDGSVSGPDIDLLFGATQGSVPPALLKFDLTGDGSVNSAPNTANSDADYLVRQILHTQYGDVNLNGAVNFDDLLALAQNYGGTSASWSQGDIDGTFGINFGDLLLMAQNYGFGTLTLGKDDFAADWALAQSMVPEPTSLAAFGLLAMRRRRR